MSTSKTITDNSFNTVTSMISKPILKDKTDKTDKIDKANTDENQTTNQTILLKQNKTTQDKSTSTTSTVRKPSLKNEVTRNSQKSDKANSKANNRGKGKSNNRRDNKGSKETTKVRQREFVTNSLDEVLEFLNYNKATLSGKFYKSLTDWMQIIKEQKERIVLKNRTTPAFAKNTIEYIKRLKTGDFVILDEIIIDTVRNQAKEDCQNNLLSNQYKKNAFLFNIYKEAWSEETARLFDIQKTKTEKALKTETETETDNLEIDSLENTNENEITINKEVTKGEVI